MSVTFEVSDRPSVRIQRPGADILLEAAASSGEPDTRLGIAPVKLRAVSYMATGDPVL